MSGRPGRGRAQRFLAEVVLLYEGDDCLTWPYATDYHGYAQMTFDRTSRKVSRLVCAEANGPPPTPKHDAAHSCGRGNRGCVTKRHLSWKTRKQNLADMIEHGTILRGARNPRSKLTETDVRAIRALRGERTLVEIGTLFGVANQTINNIFQGKSWGWL